MSEIEIILKLVQFGGYPVALVIVATGPIGRAIANWISLKAMEKHSGEDLPGQFNTLKKSVNNDMAHDIREIKIEVRKNSDSIIWIKAKLNGK